MYQDVENPARAVSPLCPIVYAWIDWATPLPTGKGRGHEIHTVLLVAVGLTDAGLYGADEIIGDWHCRPWSGPNLGHNWFEVAPLSAGRDLSLTPSWLVLRLRSGFPYAPSGRVRPILASPG
jgi:hypothetical protein